MLNGQCEFGHRYYDKAISAVPLFVTIKGPFHPKHKDFIMFRFVFLDLVPVLPIMQSLWMDRLWRIATRYSGQVFCCSFFTHAKTKIIKKLNVLLADRFMRLHFGELLRWLFIVIEAQLAQTWLVNTTSRGLEMETSTCWVPELIVYRFYSHI